MLIEVYVAESTILRVEKLIGIRGVEACEIQKEMAIIYLHRAMEIARTNIRRRPRADGESLPELHHESDYFGFLGFPGRHRPSWRGVVLGGQRVR